MPQLRLRSRILSFVLIAHLVLPALLLGEAGGDASIQAVGERKVATLLFSSTGASSGLAESNVLVLSWPAGRLLLFVPWKILQRSMRVARKSVLVLLLSTSG